MKQVVIVVAALVIGFAGGWVAHSTHPSAQAQGLSPATAAFLAFDKPSNAEALGAARAYRPELAANPGATLTIGECWETGMKETVNCPADVSATPGAAAHRDMITFVRSDGRWAVTQWVTPKPLP